MTVSFSLPTTPIKFGSLPTSTTFFFHQQIHVLEQSYQQQFFFVGTLKLLEFRLSQTIDCSEILLA